MINLFTLKFACDQPLNIFKCSSGKCYIRNLKKNLEALKRAMEDLKAIQDKVKNDVENEETRHRQRLKDVEVWLKRVEIIDTRFNTLLSTSETQLKNLCLWSLCSKNLCSSYNYGKKVYLLLEDVKILKLEGAFKEVTMSNPRSQVKERPTPTTIGQQIMLEDALNRLMDDGVGLMGLHGMGGVGKTTLFKKIHNRLVEIVDTGRFNVLIWIVVSEGANISKIQEDIAQKLHLCDDEWTKKNESDKATEIFNVLKGKRFVLMLDDMREKMDLVTIGVPIPNRENRCKVAFTTRSREVCVQMEDYEPMQVKCLDRDEAWELFKSKVGDIALSGDPVIVKLARKVAEKCRGLPLALIVIGGTMASKTTVQDWEHAVDELTKSASKYPDMVKSILPVLQYSYDSLADKDIKSCFLYCALFPEDYEIDKERLIDYLVCEGFLGEYQVIKRSKNKGYDVLRILINANLLTEVGTKEVVMHDVIREMALWIASDFGKEKESFFVQPRFGLHETPNVKNWGSVRRMSLMGNNIQEITTCGSVCSQLTTLFLMNNKLKNLSAELISSMQNLVVLDLFGNSNINELPTKMSALVSLQYLDLSLTSIKHLPVGIQKLDKLTQLNLTGTLQLCSIVGISKLSNLRILKLLGSNVHGDASLVKELQLLKNLQVVTITISTESGLEQILVDTRLVNCINALFICGFKQNPFNISLLASIENLQELWVVSSNFLENNPTSPRFNNLSKVRILNCNSIKDLTWLLFAPNLVYLNISCAEEVKEIINKDKALTNLTGIITTPFQKLEELTLATLPKLESIYWNPLPFPVLRRVNVVNCTMMKKLPLNVASVPRVGEFRITMYPREHETELEWEDDDTKNRFLPLIRSGVTIFEV